MTDAATTAGASQEETTAAAPTGEIADGGTSEQANQTQTLFAAGTKLTMRDATALLRRRSCNVIAIVGPYDSGKTSLVASLYDLFQNGPIQSAEFVASQTLHALELASHHSRIASGRAKPDSERTPVGKAGFYHLDIVPFQQANVVTLLLGDRAGEEYRSAGDDVDLAGEFPELARADVITLLADGERLVDLETRHNVPTQIEGMLRAFVEAGVTATTQCVALVLTKLDAVNGSDQAKSVHAHFDALLERLRTRYGQYFAAVEPFEVAAAPRVEGVPRGTGLTDLLTFWLSKPLVRRTPVSTSGNQDLPTRAIGRVSILPAVPEE